MNWHVVPVARYMYTQDSSMRKDSPFHFRKGPTLTFITLGFNLHSSAPDADQIYVIGGYGDEREILYPPKSWTVA